MIRLEIRKIANETQTTAQVLRTNLKHISIQTGGVRNTETSSSGTQTDNLRPMTTVGDTQTDLPSSKGVQTERPRTNATSVSTADIFDMTMDDATDAALAEAEAEAQAAREEEARKKQQITLLQKIPTSLNF